MSVSMSEQVKAYGIPLKTPMYLKGTTLEHRLQTNVACDVVIEALRRVTVEGESLTIFGDSIVDNDYYCIVNAEHPRTKRAIFRALGLLYRDMTERISSCGRYALLQHTTEESREKMWNHILYRSSVDSYVRKAAEMTSQEKNRLEHRIRSNLLEIRNLEQHISRYHLEVRSMRAQLRNIESNRNTALEESIRGSFERIYHAPVVEKLYMGSSGELHVYTNPLEIQHFGLTYYMGVYHIIIRSDGSVRIDGSEHRGNHCHPHVNNEGYPCFGDYGETIRTAIGAGEFDVALYSILEFLQSYTYHDAFVYLQRWGEFFNPDINYCDMDAQIADGSREEGDYTSPIYWDENDDEEDEEDYED